MTAENKPIGDVRVKLRGKALELVYKSARKTRSTLSKTLVENAIKQLESGDTEPVDFNHFLSLIDRQSKHIIDLTEKVDMLTYIVESFLDMYISITPTDAYKADNYKLVIKDRHSQIINLVKKRKNLETLTISERLEGDFDGE